MVLLHIILEDMSSQQMLQESNQQHGKFRLNQFNLVDIRKSVIIPSNRCYQWAIEYSVESVDIMRSYTLSQWYDKYINAPSLHFILLYLALSRYAPFLCHIFANRNNPPLTPHPSPLTRSTLTAHSLNTYRSTLTAHPLTPPPSQHTTHLTCRQSSVRFFAKLI